MSDGRNDAVSGGPSPAVMFGAAAAVGALVAVAAGVYGRLHDPASETTIKWVFTSTLHFKAWMTTLALLLAIVAPFFARLVQLAVNREREYLADASSVELTRNPYGLQRALAKIAGDKEVLEVANRATQHLYIVNPIKRFEERSKGLMSTHPPVVERINRLRTLSGEAPLTSGDNEALARLG